MIPAEPSRWIRGHHSPGWGMSEATRPVTMHSSPRTALNAAFCDPLACGNPLRGTHALANPVRVRVVVLYTRLNVDAVRDGRG